MAIILLIHGHGFSALSIFPCAFRITGPLWEESTCDEGIPITKEKNIWSVDVFFVVSLSEQADERTVVLQMIKTP